MANQGRGLARIKAYYFSPNVKTLDIAALTHLAEQEQNSDAARELSYRYADGRGVTVSPEQSFAWAEKAALSGDADDQGRLAYLYNTGYGIEADPFQAAMWYRKAVKQNNPYAMNGYGLLLVKGEGVKQNVAEGCTLIKQAAEAGISSAEHNVGLYYKQDGICGSNVAMSTEYYQRAALKGDVSSMLGLAYTFLQARGTTFDAQQGLSWLKKASAQGSPKAQAYLGWVYLHGKYGVAQDINYARELLKQADQKDVYALSSLAYMHEQGIGFPADIQQARHYYQLAAIQGHESAQYQLARLLLAPANNPSEQNLIEGYAWLKILASSHHETAISVLQSAPANGQIDLISTTLANQWRPGKPL